MYETSKSSSSLIKFGAETVEAGVHRIVSLVDQPSGAVSASPSKDDSLQAVASSSSTASASSAESASPAAPLGIYQSGRRYISEAVGRNIDAALSVAESAVDRYLPPPAAMEVDVDAAGPPSDSDADMDKSGSRSDEGSRVGRIKNIGTRVQGRLQKRALTRWNNIYGHGYESHHMMRQSVELLQVAQSHIESYTRSLGEELKMISSYLASVGTSMDESRMRALVYLHGVTQQFKKAIGDVLRRVVETISKSAALMPSASQARIKEFILMLPNRWGAIAGGSSAATNDEVAMVSHGWQVQSLAQETLNMLGSITNVFTQYVEQTGELLKSIDFGNYQPTHGAAAAAANATAVPPLSPRLAAKLAASQDFSAASPSHSPTAPSLADSQALGRMAATAFSTAEAATPEAAVPETEAAIVLSSLAFVAGQASDASMGVESPR